MEESSEKRRERLKAMREEASLASGDEGRVATPPDAPGLPLLTDLQQPPPWSPSPRFEFYTDPLAAFSGSQRKKKTKSSSGSSFGGAPTSPARPAAFQSPPSFQWQPKFASPNPSLTSLGSFSNPRPPNPNANTAPNSKPNPDLPPSGSFSIPGSPNPHHPGIMGKYYPGSFNGPGPCIPNPNSNPNDHINPNSNPNFHHPSILGRFHPQSTPPGSYSSPSPSDCNPNLIPVGGNRNSGPPAYGPRPAFGSQQPSSAPHKYNGGSSGGFFVNTPEPDQYNGGRGSFLTDSPPQHLAVGMNDVQNSAWSQGSNRSGGGFKQSPGSSRGGRTPGRSGGGRGFQRSHNHGTASALTNPEVFAKRSMLTDPWKDLVPVRIESVAFRLNSCSVSTSSRDWLPSSVSKGMASPSAKQISVSASGPSLAESLAASFADAVSGEDGA